MNDINLFFFIHCMQEPGELQERCLVDSHLLDLLWFASLGDNSHLMAALL